MKPLLFLALFTVVLGAVPLHAGPPPDAEATKLLIGKWAIPQTPGVTKGFFDFAADGTFTSGAILVAADGQAKMELEGRWKIEKGVLVEEITKSNHPEIVPVGTTTRDSLVVVTKEQFSYRDARGNEIVRFRVEK